MTITEAVEGDRSTEMLLPGEGYHKCWYPVAFTDDVPVGTSIGLEFCDDRIVVYRGEDGVTRASLPYCKHMGADLSVGDVQGNDLRCPFHHWQYGPDGACTKIPSGDRIPPSAKLTTLPTEEKRGMIWVFLGTTPLYPVPDLVEWDPETIACRYFEVALNEPLRVDPWIFSSNAFDYQHLRVLHNSPIDSDASMMDVHDYKIESKVGSMTNDVGGELNFNEVTMYGTNSLVSYGRWGEHLMQHIGAGTPMGSKGTKFFLLITVPAAGVNGRKSSDVEHDFDILQKMHTQLFNEDLPVLNSIRPGRNMFVKSDQVLAKYFRYARGYPRTSLREIEREGSSRRGAAAPS
jgi:nitrite reductase/ring-hydroxylating ferredoxin subunit